MNNNIIDLLRIRDSITEDLTLLSEFCDNHFDLDPDNISQEDIKRLTKQADKLETLTKSILRGDAPNNEVMTLEKACKIMGYTVNGNLAAQAEYAKNNLEHAAPGRAPRFNVACRVIIEEAEKQGLV